MKDCISHTGLYDDWDNPLTNDGQPYLPGERSCGHRDCVNIWHIKGMEEQALFMIEAQRKPRQRIASVKRISVKALAHKAKVELAKANQQAIYDKIVELGNSKPVKGATVCQLPFCEKPYKARNLCPNHWQMFRRQSPESLKRITRYKPDDFVNVPPPVMKRKNITWPTACVFANCGLPVRSRSLCKNHYRQFQTHKTRAELMAERPVYTLSDFAHIPDGQNKVRPAGTCSLPNCDDPQSVRTLCENHYRTYRKLVRTTKKEMA